MTALDLRQVALDHAHIHADKLDAASLDAALTKLGQPLQGSLLDRAHVVQTYFLSTTPRARLSDCDVCGATSDVALPGCPFCGTADVRDAHEMTVIDAVRLDALVDRVGRAKDAMASNAWALGCALGEIQRDKLWRARRTAEGSQAFRSFYAFVTAETGLTERWARELVSIAGAFTESDVQLIGTSKLGRVLRAPEGDRPALLAAVRGGASRTELDRRVALARVERAGTRAPKGPKFTATLTDGATWNVAMRARVSRHAGAPARELSDAPCAEVLVAPGLIVRVVVLRDPSGHLRAMVQTERVGARNKTSHSTPGIR